MAKYWFDLKPVSEFNSHLNAQVKVGSEQLLFEQ